MFSSKALPWMDGRRTTHCLRFLACNADICSEYPSDDGGRRLTIQLLRSDKVKSDCCGWVGRDDEVRYAWACRDRDKFVADRLETEDSLLTAGTRWETWDDDWGFRLNVNFGLGTREALKDSTASSRLFSCCRNGQCLGYLFLWQVLHTHDFKLLLIVTGYGSGGISQRFSYLH